MRLAFTGAHGTGKTTTARKLAEILSVSRTISISREPARLVIARVNDPAFFQRGNNTPLRQALIYIEHLLEERAILSRSESFISDRTFVDHLAYTKLLFPEIETTEEYAILRQISFDSLPGYDAIFRLPIEFALHNDGVREADVEFQHAVDATIYQLFSEADVSPVTVSGTLDERVAAIVEYLAASRLMG